MRSRERKAAWAVSAVIAFAPFAIGSAPRWAAVTAAAMCLVCAVPLVRSRRVASERSPLLIFLGLAVGFTALQLVPWPALLVAQIAPTTYQLLVDNAAALGESAPRAMMLSLDPPATLLELAKLAGYAAFAFACLRIAVTREGRRWLLTAVALVGGAMAAVALAHYAVGAKSVFGVYVPRQAQARVFGPLLNPNHLSGFMALVAPISVGLAVRSRGRARALFIGVAVACSGAALLSSSRGGAIALVLGLGVAGAIMFFRRNRVRAPIRKPPMSAGIAMGVVAFCGLLLLGTLTAGGVIEELSATRVGEVTAKRSKFGAWRSAVVLLRDHRWTGVGRGGFEASFTRVHDSGERTFSYLENEYLQAAVDWGIPAAGGLAIALILVMIAALRRADASALEAGAFGGLMALGLQSAFDFGLELPGVALPAILVIATLVHVDLLRSGSKTRRRIRVRRGAALALGTLLVGLAASPVARGARADSELVAARLRESRVATSAAARALRRHPADYLAAAQLARSLFRERDPRAVAVINRALYFHPKHSGVHHLAAQMLAQSQQSSQSLVEYSLALEHARNPRAILRELTRRFPDPGEAVRGIPIQLRHMRRFVRELRNMRKSGVALHYTRRLVEAFPDNPETLKLQVALAVRTNATKEALLSARHLYALEPTGETALLLSSVLGKEGQHAERIKVLRAALGGRIPTPGSAGRASLLLALADALAGRGDLNAARAPLVEAITLMPTRKDAARLHRKLAGLEDKLGNARAADGERDRARMLER